MTQSRRIVLAARLAGMCDADTVRTETVPVPDPGRNLTIQSTRRARLNDGRRSSGTTHDAVDGDLDGDPIGPLARLPITRTVAFDRFGDPLGVIGDDRFAFKGAPASAVDLAHRGPGTARDVCDLHRTSERDDPHQVLGRRIGEPDRDHVRAAVGPHGGQGRQMRLFEKSEDDSAGIRGIDHGRAP